MGRCLRKRSRGLYVCTSNSPFPSFKQKTAPHPSPALTPSNQIESY
uniref:Uncharacterized protein n=1 Tax=Aegilops tauschii subsp. strangulata TaxID=200361 RepID=A0A453J9Q6_AEGTS